MAFCIIDELATDDNFDEAGYLARNPDVAAAVRRGEFRSGRDHLRFFGKREGRRQSNLAALREAKARKLARIRPLLRADMPVVESPTSFDFLTDDLRRQFRIVDTSAVSSNEYDRYALGLIDRHAAGLVLDCGAGRRSRYFDNVVNFEIVAYDSTDVLGVGEVLPFADGAFDAVLSLAVLEHVKDPFRCATEIVRVLKPGGDLMCCVPFLQPLHGFPHHYYNMTHQGLANLFAGALDIDRIDCYDELLPISTLQWFLRSWAAGLRDDTRREFLAMRVSDLIDAPAAIRERPIVKELSAEKNLELASGTVLFARKPR